MNTVEEACLKFLDFGVGADGQGTVIIRSGDMGAYVANRTRGGQWIEAYWTPADANRVVDVTGSCVTLKGPDALHSEGIGAGNAFLGGLAAGLSFTDGDVFKGKGMRLSFY